MSALEVDLEVPLPAWGGRGLSAKFRAEPGLTVLRGPSGAGKSTLLGSIAGLEPTAKGTVTLGGVPWLSKAGALPVHQRGVGVVFQGVSLFPHLSVLENVRYGWRGGASPEAWLERFGAQGLQARAPRSLSGGEAQRVALARAFASSPSVLLLDEPFTALDVRLRDVVAKAVMGAVNERPIPCLLVTHDLERLQIPPRPVLELREGRLQA